MAGKCNWEKDLVESADGHWDPGSSKEAHRTRRWCKQSAGAQRMTVTLEIGGSAEEGNMTAERPLCIIESLGM